MHPPQTADRAAWGVYADWLQTRADPAGQDIAGLLASQREGLETHISGRPVWAHLCRWLVDAVPPRVPEWADPPGQTPDDTELTRVCQVAYPLFAIYARPARIDFCTHCYDAREIEAFQTTPLHLLTSSQARKLVWEVVDHWPAQATYKHFLPRMLSALAPPDSCDVLTEESFVNTLLGMRYPDWPLEERLLVERYLRLFIHTVSEDRAEDWQAQLPRLGITAA